MNNLITSTKATLEQRQNKRVSLTKIFFVILLAFFLLAIIPSGLLFVGYSFANPFSETYYAELPRMYQKLKNSSKKKIVILGTSSVAFGIHSKLLEEELNYAGLDYDVVNFGLYGAIGTRAMMELSIHHIHQDDIVIFEPEWSDLTFSTRFSTLDFYRACADDFTLISMLSSDSKHDLSLDFYKFSGEKFSYLVKHEKVSPSGVYALSSFDDNQDMTNAERNNNQMSGYYDPNTLIDLEDLSFISDDFIDSVKAFNEQVILQGGQMFFRYCPMNRLAVKDTSRNSVHQGYISLQRTFSLPILGDPNRSILEENYFYDTNFHLNSSGMDVFTLRLAEDLKTEALLTTPNKNQTPEMPELPVDNQSNVYDNQDVDCFTYQKTTDGVEINGVTNLAREKTSLIIPGLYKEQKIVSITKDALSSLSSLTSVRFQTNITRLIDGMFDQCSSLESIILDHTDPTKISVGLSLFSQDNDITIYVPKGCVSTYAGNYSWSYYANHLQEV